uniref:Uncharacterized protein n=1 Tax=Manihot esculenta TaxID=3983 RepID=A0A2C9UNZ1_MANES
MKETKKYQTRVIWDPFTGSDANADIEIFRLRKDKKEEKGKTRNRWELVMSESDHFMTWISIFVIVVASIFLLAAASPLIATTASASLASSCRLHINHCKEKEATVCRCHLNKLVEG